MSTAGLAQPEWSPRTCFPDIFAGPSGRNSSHAFLGTRSEPGDLYCPTASIGVTPQRRTTTWAAVETMTLPQSYDRNKWLQLIKNDQIKFLCWRFILINEIYDCFCHFQNLINHAILHEDFPIRRPLEIGVIRLPGVNAAVLLSRLVYSGCHCRQLNAIKTTRELSLWKGYNL